MKRTGQLCALFAIFSTLAFGFFPASGATAAGVPDLQMSATSTSPLYGENGTVSIAVSLGAGEPNGYNLSGRVVLPAGISYAGGAAIAPTIIDDAPVPGETTLLFKNVSDLFANSTQSISFQVAHDTSLYDVGDTYEIGVEAFVNSDARRIPRFTPLGLPIAISYTGSASQDPTATIRALQIEKSEPSPEGEILRGLHDHQTVYTLTVTNNAVNTTSGITLDDYLPAGLEYLGCSTGSDNTTDAPTNPGSPDEYPGSGPIVIGAVSDCFAPQSVETVQTDPDGGGPLPDAVYTHVRWTTANLAPSQTVTYRYRAAVPLVENTLTWSGITPTPGSGRQAANLDNNSGSEIRDEQELTNYAVASGTYEGDSGDEQVSTDVTLSRTAEDLTVQKSASSGTLGQGAITTWSLRFRTGEYRYGADIVATDTLPSGLCPLGPVNYTTQNDPSDAECDPTGDNPSVPYSSATENADGTFTIIWNSAATPNLTRTNVNADFTITFPTRTRTDYQENFLPTTPILANDSLSNSVVINGDTYSRCTAPGTPNCTVPGPIIAGDGGQPASVTDSSSAGQAAPGLPLIKKEVAAGGTNCLTATYVTTVPEYRPGDSVCWRLTLDFGNDVTTEARKVFDLIPPNAVYDPGSVQNTAQNTTTNVLNDSSAADRLLEWDISAGPVLLDSVGPGGNKFQVVFSTTVAPEPGVIPDDPVITANLLKFATTNTEGQTFPLRAQAEFATVVPEVELSKGVRQVNAGPIQNPPADGLTVKGGDAVTYQVDVKSTGFATDNVEVWDRLPAAFDCTEVSSISDSGTCVDGGPDRDVIKWTIPSIADGATKSLTYVVTVPSTVNPETTYVNEAGVRQYETATNTGGSFVYTPENNIDPTNTDPPNVAPIDDPSNVVTRPVAIAKSRNTSINDANNSNAQATIGETISYTVSTTLPAGTTIRGSAKVTDTPTSATTQPIIGTPTATLNGGPLPLDWSITTVGQTVTVQLPATYTVPTGADAVIAISLDTRVADTTNNVNRRGQNLLNAATVSWNDGSARSRTTPNVSTQIVEPAISQTKTNNKTGPVQPEEIITYTLTTRNASASNVSIAHDTVIKDVIPADLTPVDGVGDPIPDGGVVPGTGGATWDLGTRTITGAPVNINRNGSVVWSYQVKVDPLAIAGTVKTNNASAGTESIGGTDPNQRTAASTYNTGYVASASSAVTIAAAQPLTKVAVPSWGTIGTEVTYTSVGRIPKELNFFNLTAVDELPDGLEFDSYVAAVCIQGCDTDPIPAIQTFDPVVAPTKTTIGWYLGNVTAGSVDRVVSFTYKAHVADTYRNTGLPVKSGDSLVNSFGARSNASDKFVFDPAFLPPASSFDINSPLITNTLPVREPDLALDKKVSINGGPFVDGPVQSQPGDSLTYSVAVTNNGTSAAYDVTVDDLPDAEITNVVLGQGAAFNTKMWTSGDPSMIWEIDEANRPGGIAPGETVTFTYTAGALPSAQLATGSSASNTAGSSYFGIPEVERVNPWTYREYDSNDDTVTVDFEFPELAVDKTTTAPGFPNRSDANVGQSFGWRIVVTNNATTAQAFDTVVGDTLPPDWTYDAGSTVIAGATAAEPAIVTAPTGDVLTWDFTGQRIDPGASVTITFTAKPELAAKANPPVQTNSAVAVTDDASGSDRNLTGPYTDSDTAEANLLFPVLTVAKTPDDGTVDAGASMNWTIVINNTGTGTATDVDVDDDLQAGMIYTAGTATALPAAGFSETSVTPDPNDGSTPVNTVWNIASIPAGGTVTITVPVTALASLPDGTSILNTVDVSAFEQPGPVTDTGNVTTTLSADLEASKSFDPVPPVAGNEFTYTIGVRNLGPSNATGVKITDPLPAETTFVSAPGCTESAGTVECLVGDLAVGDLEEFVVTVKLAANAGAVSNTATVSGTTPDPNPGNDTATADFTSGEDANMAIAKTSDPGTINQGQTSVFTLVVTNKGPSLAQNVKVTDPLPAGLEYVSDDSGCTENAGDIECLLGDFQPLQSQTIKLTVRGLDVGNWTNTATVGSDTPDSDPSDDSSSADVLVAATADLKITKTAPATATAHQQFTYTLLVENKGPSAATGVVISDPLPPGLNFISSADCNAVMTCSLGTIPSGGSRTVEIVVETTPAVAGTTVVNTAEVSGNEYDPTPGDNTSTAETVIDTLADIAVVKTGPVQAQADTRIIWNLVVTNAGPNPAENVTLSDTLPPEVTNPAITTSQGSCVPSFECQLGTIPVDGNVLLTVEADIPRDTVVGTTITNSVVVDTTTDEINKDDNTSSWDTEVTAPTPYPPNVRIFKERNNSDPVKVGDVVVFKLTARNTGEVAAKNVVITDPLSAKLRYLASSIPGGTCSERNNIVTCRRASLAPDSAVTARIRVRVIDTGQVVNTATIQSNNSIISIPRWTIRFPVAKGRTNIGITKKADRRKTRAGRVIKYRIKVRNLTDQAATDVSVCDQLPARTTVVSTGGGRLEGNRICWEIPFFPGRAGREFRVALKVDRFYPLNAVRNKAIAGAGNVKGVRRANARVGVIRIRNAARGGGVTG